MEGLTKISERRFRYAGLPGWSILTRHQDNIIEVEVSWEGKTKRHNGREMVAATDEEAIATLLPPLMEWALRNRPRPGGKRK